MIAEIFGNLINFLDPNMRSCYQLLNQEIKEGKGEFEKLVLPKEINFGVHIIQYFKSHSEFSIVSGLGSDRNLEAAYVKSIVEYFERLAFFENEHKYGLTSTNGIAAHPYMKVAEKMARDEMFERDAFLRHWYSQTPFIKINNKNIVELNHSLKNLNLELIIAKNTLGFQKIICAFLIDQKTGGFALGLSTGRGKGDLDKAIFESIINYFFGHGGKSQELLMAELESSEIKTLEQHRSYWLYKQKFPSFMITSGDQMTLQKFPVLEGNSKFYILREDNLKIVKMSHQKLIELTVGDVTSTKLDLTEFKKNDLVGEFKYHPIP